MGADVIAAICAGVANLVVVGSAIWLMERNHGGLFGCWFPP